MKLFTNTLARLGTLPLDDARQELAYWRRLISHAGDKIGYDGKFDDISNTITGAASALEPLRVAWFNIHASAGIDAMMAAVANKGEAKVAAVTVLTSLDAANAALIFGATLQAKVLQLARDAKLAKVDGIICSPVDLPYLVKRPELAGFEYLTPGVRPAGSEKGDQSRTDTPGGAITAGATYVIIGRPITQPAVGTPVEAAKAIAAEIAEAITKIERS